MRRVRKVEGMYVTKLSFQPNSHLTLEPIEDGFVDYDQHIVIALPSMMTVQEKGAEPVDLNPGSTGGNRAVLDDLPHYSFVYGSCLKQCTAGNDGTLLLGFEHGRIKAPAFDDAESWQMYNDKGFRIICGPGGKLTCWSDDSITLDA